MRQDVAAEASQQRTSWTSELAEADRVLALKSEQAETKPGWLALSELAELHASRFRLTGDYDDLAAAERALAGAFSLAPPGSGPFLARASLQFTLHRLEAVEPDLSAAESVGLPSDRLRATVALTRARLQMERGDLVGAATAMEAIAVDSFPLRTAKSILYHQLGRADDAEAELGKAEAMYHGAAREPVAWMHLLRGLRALDAGRLDEALGHYRAADAALPGYWLVEEHIAEVHAARGEPSLALPLYESVVARTGSPELMSALADVLLALGRAPEAHAWAARATAGFDAELRRFPEACAGHALEHTLTWGDPAKAVALAETNALLRPNGEALVRLADAYQAVGRTEEAAAALARARATGWVWVPAPTDSD